MARTLLLTSEGIVSAVKPVFMDLLGANPEPGEPRIAYIPNASEGEKDKSYVPWRMNGLKRLGFEVLETDLRQYKARKLESRLDSADVVFVEGGNTYCLLKRMRESGFDEIVQAVLDEGKLYFGISAGSIVAGPSIELAGWGKGYDRNIPKLKDLTGLGLVPFATFPHYKPGYKKTLEQHAPAVTYPIVAITDSQAILCEGDEYRLVGKGRKVVFNQEKLKGELVLAV